MERKSAGDFISSLLDGRLFDQSASLASASGNPTMIVEGDVKAALRKFGNPMAIWGALASIGYDFRITLFHTSDTEETAMLLAAISKKRESGREEIYLKSKKNKGSLEERQISIIASLPGIGAVRAKNLLEGFRTVRAIFNADPGQLTRIGKLSYETSLKIYRIVNSEYKAESSNTQSKIEHFEK